MFDFAVIRRLRKMSGLSQAVVAEELGMARATYATLESGGREFKVSQLVGFADFFGVSAADLLSDVEVVLGDGRWRFVEAERAVDKLCVLLEKNGVPI